MENKELRKCKNCGKEMEGERTFTDWCSDCYKGLNDDTEIND